MIKNGLNINLTPALGYSFPPIIPIKGKDVIADIEEDSEFRENLKKKAEIGILYQDELRLKLSNEREWFVFPFDPIIGIKGKNIIVRRTVSKSNMRGTIKERFTQDDYEITITGVLINADPQERENLRKELAKYCEAKEAVEIVNAVLNSVFKISNIVIEDYDFPFTKGVENQSFTLKAYSDDNYTLLEENDV